MDEKSEALEEGHIEQALILAPNGVIDNWPMREIPTHMPDHLYDRSIFADWHGMTREGTRLTPKNRKAQLQRAFAEDDRYSIVTMNIEAIGASDKGLIFAEEFVKRRPTLIIIDESTKIKSHSAIVTQMADRLGSKAAMRRILTGYPNPNSPMDMYSQMNFCVPQCLGANYFSYKHRYAITKDLQVGWIPGKNGKPPRPKMTKLIVGYQRQEELAMKVERHSFRALKKDCLDLPPENWRIRPVELTDEQRRVYRDLEEQATAELEGAQFVTATMVITRLLRLHQVVCGHVTNDNGEVMHLKTNRIKSLQEEAEEMCGLPGIVWATYQPDMRRIVAALKDQFGDDKVVEYHGQVSPQDCARAIDRFMDGSADWFIGTPQKGGYGITLTRAASDFFYSNSHNLEHRLQAEARIHRSGQKFPVTHTDLVAFDTVDHRILRKLRDKIDIADTILKDGWRAWVV